MWTSAVDMSCTNLGGSSTVSLKIRKSCGISGLIGTIKAYLSALEQSAVTVNYSGESSSGSSNRRIKLYWADLAVSVCKCMNVKVGGGEGNAVCSAKHFLE